MRSTRASASAVVGTSSAMMMVAINLQDVGV
jgi:hypothetical protein